MALSRCTGVLVGALRRAAGASAGGLAESFLPRQLSSKVSVDLVIPTTNSQGAAFPEDLRSTSGLGKGDGKETHTSKWLSVSARTPPFSPHESFSELASRADFSDALSSFSCCSAFEKNVARL